MKKLVKFAVIIGAIAVIAKVVTAKKAEWEDLTESEVRDKLERLPKWIPGEKRAEIADEIVSGMREGGALRDEDEPSVAVPTDSGSGGEERDSDAAEARADSGDITASV